MTETDRKGKTKENNYVLCVICCLSHVTCRMSPVTCHKPRLQQNVKKQKVVKTGRRRKKQKRLEVRIY